ncbi:hypothetical protein ABW636_20805 [Aquimarina sp. 2201CG1-2-11]|uniref:hypothetical protein n=1 Tax=Aquimarina discodermiae TaxID=3231043 RepID=UPI003463583F
MRITTLIWIALLVCTISFSQSKNTFTIETQGGYEYNYFKSPNEIRVNDTILTKEDLISSSFYQDAAITYRFRYKKGKSKLKLFVNPFYRVFYENIDDSYWSLNARVRYEYRFTKKVTFLSEARFKRMNREGLGGDQDVLINPLGYTNYGATTGIELVPFKKHEISIEGFYNFKDFDAFGVRDLQFDEFGAQLSSVQSFEISRLKHKVGISFLAKKRLYDTFNASDTFTEGERDWDYLKGNLFYELPISEQFKIRPKFTYYARIDNSTNRSGFDQMAPEIGLFYKNKTTKISSSFAFVTRNYKEIEARDTEARIGEKLRYQYTNFTLNASHRISDGLFITATLYSRVRNTNYTDIDARSFRNYRNQYAGIGILWKL